MSNSEVEPYTTNQLRPDPMSTMKGLTIAVLLGLFSLTPSAAQEQQAVAPTTSLTQVNKAALKVTTGSINETGSGFLTITSAKVRAVEKTRSANAAKLRFRYRGPSGFLTITSAKVRAVEKTRSANAAKLRFRYRGPSEKTAPLASGLIKRQVGLKMRAKDTCNLLYVMWELERITIRSDGARDHRSPEKVVISLKRNPGKKTHSSCGAGGYETIAVIRQNDPSNGFSSAKDNKTHRLQADLVSRGSAGHDLFVYVDGEEIWNGRIAHSQLGNIDGPAGIRSDNGSFIFKFFTDSH